MLSAVQKITGDMFDKFKSKHYLCARKANRGVAQLAARHVRDVEVGSSSLLIPTHQKGKNLERDLAFLFSILLISNE